jgi:hypothetical protein
LTLYTTTHYSMTASTEKDEASNPKKNIRGNISQ